ncbi:carboxylesterase/lipase family protein [Acidisoma cladoniae]|jgi:para-nitrobenzyl esterase|uniref:carboxylesterase/lipase family protein n=1 Tax=Acidisoma cladoniae TaxID=3040935 RepID=UPI00254D2BE5|nr:carboxylesterase family protein [Acidisoma sp. PAMC 29798]
MKYSKRAALGLFLLALAAVSSPGTASATSSDLTVVQTDSGAVRGLREDGVIAFKGIPYAVSPTGALRWAPPQPAAAWSGIRDATHFGSGCPQLARYGLTEAGYNEDCLSINVTVPSPKGASMSAKRPVIAWIYGGAFVGGSTAIYPLAHMALSGNAIVVSFNYRLGVFGFMASPTFDRANDGSYGLEDQRAALGWVQRNIAAFGGDPKNVTVAGESAGAASICMHIAAPGETKGLFSKAIIQSANCTQHLRTLTEADAVGEKVATLVGCADGVGELACLQAKPVKDLLNAASKVAGSDIMMYVPSVGASGVPEQPAEALASGRFLRVPIINGGNRDELRLYVAYAVQGGSIITPANYAAVLRSAYGDKTDRVLAEYLLSHFSSPAAAVGTVMSDYRQDNGLNNCGFQETGKLASAYVSVFQYEFADRDAPPVTDNPGFEMGAVHSSELPYQFPRFTNTTKLNGPALAPGSQHLATVMMEYWTSFAATGMPAAKGEPAWAPMTSTKKIMRLEPGKVGYFDGASAHHCAFWQQLYPTSLQP